MKACDDCRKPDGSLMHPSSVRCNWLDGHGPTCPHCGGPLRSFRGTALGDSMDAMSTTAGNQAIDEVWLPIADGKRALHFTNVLDVGVCDIANPMARAAGRVDHIWAVMLLDAGNRCWEVLHEDFATRDEAQVRADSISRLRQEGTA